MASLDLKKYGMYIIGVILAFLLLGTQFDPKGIENDIKLDNRKLNNTVEIN